MSKRHRDFPPGARRERSGDEDSCAPNIGLEELASELEAFGPIYIDTPPVPTKTDSK